ncbi:MAG: glycosyltransferase, partial [Sphingomonadales bacterium]
MPVHAGERWLDETLASIVTRADVPIEVVIRDSTPVASCEPIVRRHADRLSIDYAYVPDIASWTHKTNLAVEAARAEHVAMLHQDDLWLPERLEVVGQILARDPDAALLVTGAQLVDETGRMLGFWRPPF